MPNEPRFATDIILRTALQAADEVDPPGAEPQELTNEQVERFLIRNWQEIAAKGYWGFSKQGRGAFFVFVRGALPAKLAWNEVTGIYLPAHLVDDLRGGSELVPAPTARKLAEMVAAYNPEREVVVCVANPAWEQWAALQVGHPFIMPPRAYKQSGEHAGVEIGSVRLLLRIQRLPTVRLRLLQNLKKRLLQPRVHDRPTQCLAGVVQLRHLDVIAVCTLAQRQRNAVLQNASQDLERCHVDPFRLGGGLPLCARCIASRQHEMTQQVVQSRAASAHYAAQPAVGR